MSGWVGEPICGGGPGRPVTSRSWNAAAILGSWLVIRRVTRDFFTGYVASGGGLHPFTHEALKAVFDKGHGMPRETAILCDNSLLLAFLQQEPSIDAKIVKQVIDDREKNLARRKAA